MSVSDVRGSPSADHRLLLGYIICTGLARRPSRDHRSRYLHGNRRITIRTADEGFPLSGLDCMRPRESILANLESIYRESYDRAKATEDAGRMIDLESAYMRDQLMLEILLDIRDLFSVAPAASGGSALEQLEAIRRLTRLR
jgi:hypothetical protein